MKLIPLEQDTGTEVRVIWLNPIHVITVEPIMAGEPNAHTNESCIRTTIGMGFCMESVREVVAAIDAWRGDDKPPVKDKPARPPRQRGVTAP